MRPAGGVRGRGRPTTPGAGLDHREASGASPPGSPPRAPRHDRARWRAGGLRLRSALLGDLTAGLVGSREPVVWASWEASALLVGFTTGLAGSGEPVVWASWAARTARWVGRAR